MDDYEAFLVKYVLSCLTETERRRWEMWERDKMTQDLIAKIEGVSQQAIQLSISSANQKISNKIHELKA